MALSILVAIPGDSDLLTGYGLQIEKVLTKQRFAGVRHYSYHLLLELGY